mgnify:CR=1 FL=1
MSTLKIENAALKEAVRKCSVSEKDTITLFVTEKKSADKNIAQLKTCNGNMQTSALVLVEIDTKGGETFIFPSALFSSSVSTLGLTQTMILNLLFRKMVDFYQFPVAVQVWTFRFCQKPFPLKWQTQRKKSMHIQNLRQLH